MTDPEIHEHISALVAEEHELRTRLSAGEIDPAAEQERLNALDLAFGQLAAAGGRAAAASFTGRGWIAWCRGRGSYSAAYLRQALDAEPGYRLAELLLELVRRGTLCGWAARKEAAWQKFGPDAA